MTLRSWEIILRLLKLKFKFNFRLWQYAIFFPRLIFLIISGVEILSDKILIEVFKAIKIEISTGKIGTRPWNFRLELGILFWTFWNSIIVIHKFFDRKLFNRIKYLIESSWKLSCLSRCCYNRMFSMTKINIQLHCELLATRVEKVFQIFLSCKFLQKTLLSFHSIKLKLSHSH